MKGVLYTLMFCLTFFISCNQIYTMEKDGGAIVKCRITGMESNGESIDSIKSILTQRLQHIDSRVVPSIQYNESDSTYTVELPGIINPDIKLLFSHGEINISELYDAKEVIRGANSMLLDSICRIFGPVDMFAGYSTSSLLWYVYEEKVPVADSIIKANYKSFDFPRNLRLAWGSPEPSRFNLYMLKETKDNININETFIKSHVEKLSYGDSFGIMISLDEKGAKQFEKLTAINVGRQLAFCIDNWVLYAPTVNDRIEGGRMSITGGFTEGEMILLNSVLYSPIIKSDIEILDISIKEKAKR